MKKFLAELKTLPTVEDYTANIKAHNLPVVIFGAGVCAATVTDNLKARDIEIAGYAVDGKYYKPNQTYLDKPILNFDELAEQPKNYIFVCGISIGLGEKKFTQRKRLAEFFNDARLTKYFIPPKVESISREYIFEHADEFEETYNLLEDELSRQTMVAYLKTNVTEDATYLKDVLRPDEYFNELTRDAVDTAGGGCLTLIAAHT